MSALKSPASSADARDRIVSAARRSFATAGFEGASTRQIAADAGVAQSLLLYHFGSKDALWRAVMDALFENLRSRVATATREVRDGTVRERLEAAVRAFIDLCAEDADLHRIITIEGRHQNERLKWLVEKHLRDNYRASVDLIRQGQAEGCVRAGDPTLLYYSFIAIAGTTFSLAPEIGLLTGNEHAVDPMAIEALITALMFTQAQGSG